MNIGHFCSALTDQVASQAWEFPLVFERWSGRRLRFDPAKNTFVFADDEPLIRPGQQWAAGRVAEGYSGGRGGPGYFVVLHSKRLPSPAELGERGADTAFVRHIVELRTRSDRDVSRPEFEPVGRATRSNKRTVHLLGTIYYPNLENLVEEWQEAGLVAQEKKWVERISEGIGHLPLEQLPDDVVHRIGRIADIMSEHRKRLARELKPLFVELLLDHPPESASAKRQVAYFVNQLLRENALAIAHPAPAAVGNDLPCSVFVRETPGKPEGWFVLGLKNREKAAECKVAFPAVHSLGDIKLIEAPREERRAHRGKK